MKKPLLFPILISCIVFQINNFCFSQHGIGPDWGTAVELPVKPGSNEVGGFLYSNMAVLSNNKRVLMLNNKPNDIYIVESYDGVNWSINQDFAPVSVLGLNSPKLISDQNDVIHVVWVSNVPKGLFYTQMDSALNVIIDSVRISDNPRFGIYKGVYLTVDKSNRLHVMWHEGNQRLSTDTSEAFYSRSIDLGATWSNSLLISDDDLNHSCFPRGQFNAYSGDSLAIAWRDIVSTGPDIWDIKMITSTDGGANWSTPFNINSNGNNQADPDFVIAPDGRFHLFFHEHPQTNGYWSMRVFYGYSDDLGQTWNPPTFIDTVCNPQRSELIEGCRYDIQNNLLWSFWKEEDLIGLAGGDMVGAYSTDNGLTWSDPEYITDNDSISIAFKSVALLPNGQVAVNYEVPDYPNPGDMRVFYNERGPVTPPCPEVTGLNTHPVTPNSAQLNWESSNNALSYVIRGRNITNQNWTTIEISGGSQSQFSAFGLSNNTSYVWQIMAYCDSDETINSVWSETDTFTTGCSETSMAWSGPVTSSSARLNWNTVPGSVGYQIKGRKLGGTSWTSLLIGGGSTSYKDVYGLISSMPYEWTIRTICNTQQTLLSDYTSLDTFSTTTSNAKQRSVLHQKNEDQLSVYPNPFSNQVAITFKNLLSHDYSIRIIDLTGNCVFELKQIKDEKVIFDRDGLPSGCYFLEVDNGSVLRKKLIIQ